MKMAKADERDIEAAGSLIGLLDSLSRGHYPVLGEPSEDTPDYFDPDDKEHLKALYDALDGLLDKAPGFAGRVIGGMCYVILWDKNKIIDPDADTLELHPNLTSALRDEARLEHLLRHLPGNALRQVVGELSDTSDLIAFRSAIDAAIEARRKAECHG
ncbi:hypothetical protein ACFO3A_01175 [Comamonas nitrativorans]|uniref:Uncharacterized protein n=1 Tax=Comamonas nitrativorans TaxID=108437 RepID=A0ABV9GVV9_9BURK